MYVILITPSAATHGGAPPVCHCLPPLPPSQLCKRPYTIRIMDYGLLDREYTIEEATGFVSPKVGRQFLVIGLTMFVLKNKTLAFRM